MCLPCAFKFNANYSLLFSGTVIDVIKRYEQPPTQKYKYPMTESQEIGFITTPLVSLVQIYVTDILILSTHKYIFAAICVTRIVN